jgi:hypothetical protein
MTSKISVERQFHFHCSCGAITITGERTVTCTGCGITLGVRRVRRHRQRSDTVTYYGGTFNGRTIPVRRVEKRRPHLNTTATVPNARILSRFSAWVKTALAKCVKAINVHRISEPGQISNPPQPLEAQALHEARDQPRRESVIKESLRGGVRHGMHVKVGPTRLDGKPHPHAGKTGRITKFIDAYTDPYWLGLPSAMIKLDSGIEPQGFIWVSLECLGALPDLMHFFPHACNDV